MTDKADLYQEAVKFAKEKASISYVQRKCRCSYNDAERMLEQMVSEGVISTYGGRKGGEAVGAGGVQALQPEGGPPGSGGWQHHAETMERERDHWRERARTMEEHQRGTVWYWQGDGNDHPESMVNSLPVVIRADQLRALIAGRVQALSAAPARPTVEQVEDEVSMGHGAWDMVDPQELIGAVLRLAASPTPPAEQQVQTGAVYAELPAPNLPRGGFPDLFTEGQMRDFADRTHAMRMQAAPKAAPGEQNESAYQRGYMDGMAKGRRDAEAAPQQEAQEPALFVSPKQLAALTDPDDPEGEHGRYLPVRKTSKGLFTQALYTEPQPAPAPLSDDTERLREALQRIEGASMSMYATRSDMLEHCQDIARAALAAQGGKA